jgi:thymidylate kinase
MITVALIGPDGAGKTTVARALDGRLSVPVHYLYMGVSADSSNRLLPTTRAIRALKRARGAPPDTGGPPDPSVIRKQSAGSPAKRAKASAKAGLRLANRLAEEWSRQLVAWRHERQGAVVVFDRHFYYDYYAYDVAGGPERTFSRRAHGFALSHLYPKPDLVIYLDAPAELLLARKGEGTVEALERRRGEYLELGAVAERFVVVDASQPLEDVVGDVARAIQSTLEELKPGTVAPAPGRDGA